MLPHAFFPAIDLPRIQFRVRKPGPFTLDLEGGSLNADFEFSIRGSGDDEARGCRFDVTDIPFCCRGQSQPCEALGDGFQLQQGRE